MDCKTDCETYTLREFWANNILCNACACFYETQILREENESKYVFFFDSSYSQHTISM